jgi:hypothetical protein
LVVVFVEVCGTEYLVSMVSLLTIMIG